MSDCSLEDGFVYTMTGAYIPCFNVASEFIAQSMVNHDRTPQLRRWSVGSIDQPSFASSSSWDDDSAIFHHLNRCFDDFDFDSSCLNALDDQLLTSPFEAFADLCWVEAIRDENRSYTPHRSPSTDSSSVASTISSMEDLKLDHDDEITIESTLISTIRHAYDCLGIDEESPWSPDSAPPVVEEKYQRHFEPYFTLVQSPQNSVQFSPDSRQRKERRSPIRRIASMAGLLKRSVM